MSVYTKIQGIIGNLFQLGGPSGPGLKNNSGVVEARNSTDTAMATMRFAQVATGAALTTGVDLLSLQGRVADIANAYAGDSVPAAGNNTNNFVFVHTTSGGYNAGDVIYDDGSTLTLMPTNVVKAITSRSAVTGTISLIANGLYVNQGGSWTLKGDGSGSSTGPGKWINIAYTNTPTSATSTTSLAAGDVITRVINSVSAVFTAGVTIAVKVGVATATQTIQATTENVPQTAGQYENEDVTVVASASAGPILFTITGTPSQGGGNLYVHYATPLS